MANYQEARVPGSVSNLTLSEINTFNRKISGKEAVRAGKGFTLYMNDIIKIIKSLEDSGVLIDGVTETVKNKIKKTRRWISSSFTSTFSRFISTTCDLFSGKSINGGGVRKAGRG